MKNICYTIFCSGDVTRFDIRMGLIPQKTEYGGVAHLGERLNGIQEAVGSIPIVSIEDNTTEVKYLLWYFLIHYQIGNHGGLEICFDSLTHFIRS